MAVLVLGATGFIGPGVVRALEAFGVEVVAASRRGGLQGVAVDRCDTLQVRALVRDRRIDTVIDLLAYTEADTLPLLDALEGEVDRWVMASSGDVYRNYEGLHKAAAPEPLLEPLTETAPLRHGRYPYRADPPRTAASPEAWMDHYDKIPLEMALRARPGLSGTILRLPMVFGPQDRQRRFRWIVAPMSAGKARITVDPAWAAWRTTYGYVDDMAHALATAALYVAAAGQTFNIGERDAPDHSTWLRRFADTLDWRGEIESAAALSHSPIAALDLGYPMATDNRAFRDVCGWREPTPLAEALARTADDEIARG